MNEQMEFPNTFDEFADYYGFKDSEEIYTNGSMLIPIFRVKQWLEHDNKLRRIETDTAYECGRASVVSVIEDIKAEIEEQVLESLSDGGDDWFTAKKVNECLEIIDKHIAESER